MPDYLAVPIVTILVMALLEIRWWRYEASVWEKMAADRLDMLERWTAHSIRQEGTMRSIAAGMLRPAQCTKENGDA